MHKDEEVEQVRVEILGGEYVLRSRAGGQRVRRVAQYFNQQVEQVAQACKPSTSTAAIVLAALNITNELLHLKDQQESMLKEIEANTERLLERIEQGNR